VAQTSTSVSTNLHRLASALLVFNHDLASCTGDINLLRGEQAGGATRFLGKQPKQDMFSARVGGRRGDCFLAGPFQRFYSRLVETDSPDSLRRSVSAVNPSFRNTE
jgi:hypothetical protein